MKRIITLFCAMLFVAMTYAQNEYINYKAVIKDGSGNIVANQLVGLQFQIRQTTSTGTVVYTETHSSATDVNGILILDIGGGTTSDVFSDINWGSDNHFLNVQIDITGGTSYTDLGTTEFKSVPYALNVNGLEKLTEGGKTGWRLETDPDLDGGQLAPIGNKAIDMTIHDDGFWSFAGASGDFSFVVNKDNYASGAYSSAFGISSRVTGAASISAGNMGDVSGNSSFGFGSGLLVSADDATAVGEYNSDDTNAAFMVGNGTFSSRSNAFTVQKNGNTTINGQTVVNYVTADANRAFSAVKNDPPGSFSDAAGVYGENIVDNSWGYGVHGNGNYQGVRGVSPIFGVYGTALGPNTTTYGVYGTATGGTSNNYAVYASGDLVYTGSLVDASDSKLKTNVNNIGNVLDAITSLKPSKYYIKESYQRSMNMSSKQEYGFIAQELQDVFPDLVSRNVHPGETREANPIEYLGVNYIGLIPILTKGIQEQQEEIETLKNKVTSQEQTIALLIERIEALENK